LHNRIQGLEKKAKALEETLDRIQTAIVLVDSAGRVLLLNKSATTLFQSQPYIRLTANGLRVSRTPEHQQLGLLIRNATQTGLSITASPGGAMSISRSSFQRPFQVLVSPLKTETVLLGGAVPTAIVFISDPERSPLMPAQWLRSLYGLTPGESRLAQLLARGCDLKESSEQLRVRQSTVRSQLKSIFAKTETNRQSELVRLLLMGAIQLGASRETKQLDAPSLRFPKDKV
jgi:DNA-binding CsgD family transcriptional regulator